MSDSRVDMYRIRGRWIDVNGRSLCAPSRMGVIMRVDETDYCYQYGMVPGSQVSVTFCGELDDITNHGSLDEPQIMAVVHVREGFGILVPVGQIGPYQSESVAAKTANEIVLNVWREFGCPAPSGAVWFGGSSTLKDVYTYLRKCNVITEGGKIRGEI